MALLIPGSARSDPLLRHRGSAVRCAVVALCCSVLLAAGRDADEPSEYQVKAAFIYNFVKFVVWPAQTFKSPGDPLMICIVGNDPFNGALEEAVRGKSIDGHPLVVRVAAKIDSTCECQILFVSRAGVKRPQSVAAMFGSGVLIIGESPGFASKGGVINFKLQDGRVRFEINPEAAEREQLRISSKLLSLAEIVKSAP
ncbi:MAG TPA: YfiR family protein [Bryobacteraceae bacterium]|nr:YfiR family protein [Bryobacteraceae bacterium]